MQQVSSFNLGEHQLELVHGEAASDPGLGDLLVRHEGADDVHAEPARGQDHQVRASLTLQVHHLPQQPHASDTFTQFCHQANFVHLLK